MPFFSYIINLNIYDIVYYFATVNSSPVLPTIYNVDILSGGIRSRAPDRSEWVKENIHCKVLF